MDSADEITTHNEWKAWDEELVNLKSASESVAKGMSKLKASIIEGSLDRYQDLARKIQVQLNELNSKISVIGNQLNTLNQKTDEIQESVEKLCKNQKLSEHIFKSGSYLIVFPLVVRFEKSTDGTLTAVGASTTTSLRPDYIVKQIKAALESQVDPNAFMKSLRAAHSLLKRSDKQQDVSLEEIRQLMSISHDSTSRLSVSQFGMNLQFLYGCKEGELKTPLPRFVPVAAASRSYLLFKSDGASVSVGSIAFEDKGA